MNNLDKLVYDHADDIVLKLYDIDDPRKQLSIIRDGLHHFAQAIINEGCQQIDHWTGFERDNQTLISLVVRSHFRKQQ